MIANSCEMYLLCVIKVWEIRVLDRFGGGGGLAILNWFRIKIFSELLMSSLRLRQSSNIMQHLDIASCQADNGLQGNPLPT